MLKILKSRRDCSSVFTTGADSRRLGPEHAGRRDRAEPDIYGLHMLILWVCVIIAVVVFGAMIYSIVNSVIRKARSPPTSTTAPGLKSSGRSFPIAILVGMAVPATETLIR